MRNFLTSRHISYWKKRPIDWKAAYHTPDHPHRGLIIKALKHVRFHSLIEAGCATGANLYKIRENFPGVEVGGIDISPEAVKGALDILGDCAVMEQGSVTDMFLSDKSADVLLTDACLIYVDPFNIHKALQEIKRVARNNVLFVEFHSSSWIKRQVLRIFSGYNAYDYKKLLYKHGFTQIEMLKLTEKDWPGGEPWRSFGYIISAKIP